MTDDKARMIGTYMNLLGFARKNRQYLRKKCIKYNSVGELKYLYNIEY